eukprot:gene560-3877_t
MSAAQAISTSNNELQRPEVLSQARELEHLLAAVVPRILDYWRENANVDETKVVEYIAPEELKEKLGITLPVEGVNIEEVVKRIDLVLKHSVRTGHPRFLDKLFAGSDPIGQVTEFLTAVLNANVYTYAVAPVFTLMELEVIRKMAEIVGFNLDTVEGMLVPGGSFANMVGMIAARHNHFPHVRMEGWKSNDRPVAFCSAQAHYSVKRASMMLGFGMDGVVSVEADRQGLLVCSHGAVFIEIFGRIVLRSLEKAVEKAIKEGRKPFFVNTTAATTVMGGFDHFEQIRHICDKYKMWMHVDAAWGISAKFTPALAGVSKGMELADSCAWDGHKSLGMPIFSAAIMTQNHKGLMRSSNSSSADYLFHSHEEVSYDLGDMTLQCGRRADALKMWFSWLKHGSAGFRQRIEHSLNLTEYIVQRIQSDKRFRLVEKPVYTNICFWYLPPSLRDTQDLESVYTKLDTVTKTLFRRMQLAGSMMISFNPLLDHSLPRFFRLILNNTTVNKTDMDFVLEEMDRLGEDL